MRIKVKENVYYGSGENFYTGEIAEVIEIENDYYKVYYNNQNLDNYYYISKFQCEVIKEFFLKDEDFLI
jgi:hypothetical protein